MVVKEEEGEGEEGGLKLVRSARDLRKEGRREERDGLRLGEEGGLDW